MSEYKVIDMSQYPRKEHFEHFMQYGYPYMGATVNVDITDFMLDIKKRGNPFFLSFLYYVTKAANSVPEFRQRIIDDKIIEFHCCASSHTVAKADGTFSYCRLEHGMKYDDFLEYAEVIHNQAAIDGNLAAGKPEDNLYFISSIPWMSFTSLIQPVPFPADSNPRITWGKYFKQDNRILIPVSVLCHHALLDGVHMSNFYLKLDELLSYK